MISLVNELIRNVPTCYCRVYPVEVNPETRQGDESHLPTACNPQGENLGPDKSDGLFQAVKKFGKMMTGIMKKYTDLCLHFRITPLSTFIKWFMNQGLKNNFLSCNLIIPLLQAFSQCFFLCYRQGSVKPGSSPSQDAA